MLVKKPRFASGPGRRRPAGQIWVLVKITLMVKTDHVLVHRGDARPIGARSVGLNTWSKTGQTPLFDTALLFDQFRTQLAKHRRRRVPIAGLLCCFCCCCCSCCCSCCCRCCCSSCSFCCCCCCCCCSCLGQKAPLRPRSARLPGPRDREALLLLPWFGSRPSAGRGRGLSTLVKHGCWRGRGRSKPLST